MNDNPLNDLLRDVRQTGKPSLKWIVWWSRFGREPVREARDVNYKGMINVALIPWIASDVRFLLRDRTREPHLGCVCIHPTTTETGVLELELSGMTGAAYDMWDVEAFLELPTII